MRRGAEVLYRRAYIEKTVQEALKEDRKYVFRMIQKEPHKVVKVKTLRLIKKYSHIAQFEDARGIRMSFGYPDCMKMLKGESVEC